MITTTKADSVRLVVVVPDWVRRAFKAMAAKRGVTMNDFFVEIVRQLSEREKE